MPRSNSDLLLFLVLALSGCSALQVEVPDDAAPRIRAAATGVLIPNVQEYIDLSRPLSDSSERQSDLPWIDPQSRLRLEAVGLTPSYWYRPGDGQGLGGYSYLGSIPDTGQLRLRGVLRWNASSPFSLANPLWVDDSVDAPVESGETLAIDTTSLLADLPLRWPRLAGLDSTEQRAVASRPDSLSVLLEDWFHLCRSRSRSPEVKVGATLADTAHPWQTLDTTSLRRILQDSLRAFVTLQTHDTLFPALYSWNNMVLDLESKPSLPFFVNHVQGKPYPNSASIHPQITSQYPASMSTRLLLRVTVPNSWDSGSVQSVQIAGTCPAFVTWQSLGFSNRLSRPHGNLDPLDGYLCLLHPHRIDFPLAPAFSYRHDY